RLTQDEILKDDDDQYDGQHIQSVLEDQLKNSHYPYAFVVSLPAGEAAGWLYAFANTLACIAPAALCLVATRIELHALADPSSAGLGFLADHFDQTQTQFLVAR